jgi:hypothetical protein
MYKVFLKHCGKGTENGIENAEKARPDIGRARPEARGVARKEGGDSKGKRMIVFLLCLLPACLPSYSTGWKVHG